VYVFPYIFSNFRAHRPVTTVRLSSSHRTADSFSPALSIRPLGSGTTTPKRLSKSIAVTRTSSQCPSIFWETLSFAFPPSSSDRLGTSRYCIATTFLDGRFVLSGSEDGKIWIWDLQTREALQRIDAHRGQLSIPRRYDTVPLTLCVLYPDATVAVVVHPTKPMLASAALEKVTLSKLFVTHCTITDGEFLFFRFYKGSFRSDMGRQAHPREQCSTIISTCCRTKPLIKMFIMISTEQRRLGGKEETRTKE
jgi:WD40 repeat protein